MSTENDPEYLEDDYKLFGFIRMKKLKCCNNPNGFLAYVVLFVLANGIANGGAVNANISTLERRFGLSSTQSAVVVIGYEAAFCLSCFAVSYFGAKRNRAFFVAIGCLAYALGSLIYALPHFISPLYEPGDEEIAPALCIPLPTRGCIELNYFFWVLLLGHVVMGMGVTPLWTLGLAYMEESVAKRRAPIYIGIMNACALIGPIIGFVGGGIFLRDFYVDFDQLKREPIKNSDTRWVGAWWVMPMLAMAICLATSIPLAGFPKFLPGTKKHRLERISEEQRVEGDSSDTITSDTFVKTFKTLMTNPVYVMVIVAGTFQMFLINGAVAFTAKFMETGFHLTAADAAIYAGAALIPAGVLANIGASIFISFFQLKIPAILRGSAFFLLLSSSLIPVSFSHCSERKMAGVTTPYNSSILSGTNLVSSCNENCKCQEEYNLEVCGSDGVTYFSGCHAGCSVETEGVLYNCSCIDTTPQSATFGACATNDCTTLPIFLTFTFFAVMTLFIPLTPTHIVLFRVVPSRHRSFAIGLFWFFARALGTIPGPLVYGATIDSICTLWQRRQCDGSRGSCLLYENRQFAIAYVILWILPNIFSGCAFLAGSFLYKPPKDHVTEKNGLRSKEEEEKRAPGQNEKQDMEIDNQAFVVEETAS